MFHTRKEANPWLQVKLKKHSEVHQVIIYNRRTHGERMKNVQVMVGFTKFHQGINIDDLNPDEICARYVGPGGDGELIMLNCTKPMKGDYVSIQLMQKTPTYLNFNEIIIFGHAGK